MHKFRQKLAKLEGGKGGPMKSIDMYVRQS